MSDTSGTAGKGGTVAPGGGTQGFENSVVQDLSKLTGKVLEASVQRPRRLLAKVRPEGVVEVCRLLKGIGFDHLSCVTCVDYDTELEMVYHLWSYGEKCLIELRARISGTEPKVRSLCSIWTGAEFHEREAFDMFGVVFDGCPNLTRVLLPEEWTIFPLRKSFKVESLYSLHEKEKKLDAEKAKAAKAQAAAPLPPPPGPQKGEGQKGDNAPPVNVVPKKEGEPI